MFQTPQQRKKQRSKPRTIAKQVQQFIEQNGYYVVHIRRIPTLPCPRCVSREPSPHCPVCFGTAFIVRANVVKVHTSAPERPDFDEQNETPISIMGPARRIFFCLPEANPNEKDLLFEVTWTVPTERVRQEGQVLYIHKVYEISHVDPLHGEGGELCFYKMALHDLDIDISWLMQQLNSKPRQH